MKGKNRVQYLNIPSKLTVLYRILYVRVQTYLQVSTNFSRENKNFVIAFATQQEHNLLRNAVQLISWTARVLLISYFGALKCQSHVGSISSHYILFHSVTVRRGDYRRFSDLYILI